MAGLTQTMVRQIKKLISPLRRDVALMIGRGVVTLSNDDTKFQEVQIKALASEVLDQIERMQNYGMSSRMHDGAEAVFVSLGGKRSHSIVLAADDRRYRPTGLEKGEVVFYTDEDKASGDHRVYFKRGKEIHIIAGKSKFILTPAGITLEAVQFVRTKAT